MLEITKLSKLPSMISMCLLLPACRSPTIYGGENVTQLGFFSREAREFTEKILEKNLPKNEKDVVLAKIYSNEEEMQMIDYHNNFSAMARTTGFSTAIIAKMILDGEIKEGAHPPEIAVDAEKFMKELEKRNIKWRRRSLQI